MSKLLKKRPTKPRAPTEPKEILSSYSSKTIYSSSIEGSEILELMKECNCSITDLSFLFYGDDNYSCDEIEISINAPLMNNKYSEQMVVYESKLEIYHKKMEIFTAKLSLWNEQKKQRDDEAKAKKIEALEYKLSQLRK
jgi:hypothetical protein